MNIIGPNFKLFRRHRKLALAFFLSNSICKFKYLRKYCFLLLHSLVVSLLVISKYFGI